MSETADSHSISPLLRLLEIRVDKCVDDTSSRYLLITTITNSDGQGANWQVTKRNRKYYDGVTVAEVGQG